MWLYVTTDSNIVCNMMVIEFNLGYDESYQIRAENDWRVWSSRYFLVSLNITQNEISPTMRMRVVENPSGSSGSGWCSTGSCFQNEVSLSHYLSVSIRWRMEGGQSAGWPQWGSVNSWANSYLPTFPYTVTTLFLFVPSYSSLQCWPTSCFVPWCAWH